MSPLDKVLNTFKFAQGAGKNESNGKAMANTRHGQKEEGSPDAGKKLLSRIPFTVNVDRDVDEEDVEKALLELKYMSQQCRSFGAPAGVTSMRSRNESLLRSVRPSVAPPCGTSIGPKEVEDREKAEATARAAWHQQRQKQLQSSVGLEEGTSSASSASVSVNPPGKENTEVRIKTRIGHARSLRIPQYLLDGSAHGHTDTPVGHYVRSGTGQRHTLHGSKGRVLSDTDSQDDSDDDDAYLARHTLPCLGQTSRSFTLAKDGPAEVQVHARSQGTLPPIAMKSYPEALHLLPTPTSLLTTSTPATSARLPLPALSAATSVTAPATKPGRVQQQRPSTRSQLQLDLQGLFAEEPTDDPVVSARSSGHKQLLMSGTDGAADALQPGCSSQDPIPSDRTALSSHSFPSHHPSASESDLCSLTTASGSLQQQDSQSPVVAEGRPNFAQGTAPNQGSLDGVEDLVVPHAPSIEPVRCSSGSLSHADSDSPASPHPKVPVSKSRPQIRFQGQKRGKAPPSHFLPDMDNSSALHRWKGTVFAGNKQNVGRMDMDSYIHKLEAENKGAHHMAPAPSLKRSKSLSRSMSMKKEKGLAVSASDSLSAAVDGSNGNAASQDGHGGLASMLQQFAEAESEVQRLRDHSRATRLLNKGHLELH